MPTQNYSGDYFIKLITELYNKTGTGLPSADMSTLQRLVDEERKRQEAYSTWLRVVDGKIDWKNVDLPFSPLYSELLAESKATIEVPISGAFKHLMIVGSGRTTEAAYYSTVGARFNGDSGANYRYQYDGGVNATQTAAQGTGATGMVIGNMAGASADANAVGCLFAILPNAFGALYKSSMSVAGAHQGTAADMLVSTLVGFYQSTAPVMSMTILPGSGSFVAGTAISVYGLK